MISKSKGYNTTTDEDLERDVTVEEYMVSDEDEYIPPEIDEEVQAVLLRLEAFNKKYPQQNHPDSFHKENSIYDSMSDEEIHQKYIEIFKSNNPLCLDERQALKQHEYLCNQDAEKIQEENTIHAEILRLQLQGKHVPGFRIISYDPF